MRTIDGPRVSVELGKTWSFADAVDWPGWCRRGKGEEAALEALLEYADRYALVTGAPIEAGPVTIIGRSTGTATTDFGAPDARGPWDDEVLTEVEADRLLALVEAGWRYLDDVVAVAPAELRKGPRGGGRDRDAVREHVREAERSYARKIGARVPPRTDWNAQRTAIAAAIRQSPTGPVWSRRHFMRRTAWHVLDHAWEIEDRSE